MEIDLARAVLLAIDFQREWTDLYATPDLLARVAQVQEEARRAGVKVIHVRTALGDAYLNGGLPLTRYQQRLKDRGWGNEGTPGSIIHPTVGPRLGEMVITKQHEGPFVSTDLEQVLRRLDAHYLVVAGIPTSAAVRNIGSDGPNRHFNVILLSDCCQDQDPAVHSVLMGKVLNHQCQIATSGELLTVLRRGSQGPV